MTIAVVGKYISHRDAYKSVYESLDHAGIAHSARIVVRRVEAEELRTEGADKMLAGVDGVLVPGGFGMRGIEGKIEAIRYARTQGIPFFGICLGMQCATIEFARNVLGLDDANSTEFDGTTQHPVIAMMEEQAGVHQRGGTMRLGSWPCQLAPGSRAAAAYGAELVHERHRHRYEFNNAYRTQFEQHGFRPDRTEPRRHARRDRRDPRPPLVPRRPVPPRVQVEAHRAHPLFRDFIAAALARRERSAEPTASSSWTPPSIRTVGSSPLRKSGAIVTSPRASAVPRSSPHPARETAAVEFNARHYETGNWVRLSLSDGRRSRPSNRPTDRDERQDDDDWVAPAFWDIQTTAAGASRSRTRP